MPQLTSCTCGHYPARTTWLASACPACLPCCCCCSLRAWASRLSSSSLKLSTSEFLACRVSALVGGGQAGWEGEARGVAAWAPHFGCFPAAPQRLPPPARPPSPLPLGLLTIWCLSSPPVPSTYAGCPQARCATWPPGRHPRPPARPPAAPGWQTGQPPASTAAGPVRSTSPTPAAPPAAGLHAAPAGAHNATPPAFGSGYMG